MPTRAGSLTVLALYAALALAAFYPQSFHPSDAVAYVGDPVESVYLVAWNVHQLFRSPAHLFDANVLYPLPHALSYTDHRLLPSILVAPVVWATGNPVLAYNVAVLLARPRVIAPRVAVLATAALAAAVVLLPLVWPYVQSARVHRLSRELPEGVDAQHYLSTAPTNLIYGALGAEVRRQQRGPHFV